MTIKLLIFSFLIMESSAFAWEAKSSIPEFTVEPIPVYDALFQRETGWTGADGAFTIPLTPEKTLWLFSDTWVGRVRDNKHVDSAMINNSIGIQNGKDITSATVSFYYQQPPDGKPLALIVPTDGHGWFWLFHGALVPKGLYLFLMQIERTDDESVFGFQHVGTWLGHVENPLDAPNDWRIVQRKIPFNRTSDAGNKTFGSALLEWDNFIYIYGNDEEKRGGFLHRSMTLARVAKTEIDDFNAWRFYTNGEWQNDWTKTDRLFGDMATEFSVSYQPFLKKFLVLYTESGMSEKILIRLSDTPWGPWSDPVTIHHCPEVKWHSSYFCYAAKGHPSLSSAPNELIFTYVTNSFDFFQMASDARIYHPRFLRLTFTDKH